MTQKELIQTILSEIERYEEEARKIRISREVTTNQAIGADGQVKLCTRIKDFIASLPTEEEQEESEGERIRQEIIDYLHLVGKGDGDYAQPMIDKWIAWLEKQKENIEKEYVFRPLAGTDITIAAEQAIRRANEGDRLVLSFNGAYIPVRKGCNANKIVEIYDAFIEKQKEQKPVHTAKEMWKEMRLEVYAQASGNRHEPNYSDDSTKMFSLCDIDEIFENIGDSTVGSQPAEWSEEDEAMIKSILFVLESYVSKSESASSPSLITTYPTYYKEIDWLKSLRPQKPIRIVTPRYAPPVLDGNVVKETSSVGTYPEPSCQTCTNDKGCVTCVGKELWEGEQKQELPAEFDLEKEIETAWDKINCSVINFGDFADIAEHFYELGKVSQPKPRSRFEQPICTITQKECRNLRIVKDQYGVKYGHCMKADCYLWDVEECSDEKPIKKGGKR